MKVELKEKDIKTLEEVNGVYNYTIRTMNGNDIKGSNIDSKEGVIKHAEDQCERILKSMLKKK
mgnify:CR=1 FL=1|jgi:predicted transglutaminase-like cysteine proteinase|tara:strand:- start:1586 stop:1774 length:189 start_codon:yes stop_codon:yes gene_type:complete